MPVQYVEELTADVGCNVGALWRVELGYVSFSAPLLVVYLGLLVRQFICEAAVS